jgi:hypothetical protein
MIQSLIHWRCGFHMSVVTQYLLTILRSTVTLFSLKIYGSTMIYRFWHIHASAMTLFLLSISCVGREFIDDVDSSRELSLSFQGWFLVYSDPFFADNLWINSDIAFLTIPCVSHDSTLAIDLMCRSWIHLCYWFHTSGGTQFSEMISISIMNQFLLTIYWLVVT